MPLITDYERTYSAPPEPIGSTTEDIDYDEYYPPETDEEEFDPLWKDMSGINFDAINNPSDTEIL
jgi:hypothetical protein